jgi:uncharacterized membrane protein
MASEEKNSSKLNFLNWILIIAICLFIGLIIAYFSFIISQEDTVKSNWGTFGDFIGGTLNPLFALFSLFAIIYTIKIQTKELELSREELEATRKELEGSRIAQQEQSESLKLQNEATRLQMFENTFFKLLDLYKDTKKDLYFELIGWSLDKESFTFLETTDCPFILSTHKREFSEECQVFSESAIFAYLQSIQIINDKSKETINELYPDFHLKLEKYIGKYFSTIYQILKFIKNANLNDSLRYAHFLRSQFSQIEFEVLFYHCASDIGIHKFKPLLEEYEFLEHLNFKKYFKEKDILKYDKRVFGKNKDILKKYYEFK